MLASDLHLRIGGVPLVLPVHALDGYEAGGRRIAIARTDDGDWPPELEGLRASAARAETAPELSAITLEIGPYGSSEFDRKKKRICPLFTRQWARSLCGDPWAPLARTLPQFRFSLTAARSLGVVPDHVAIDCGGQGLGSDCTATMPVARGVIASWPVAPKEVNGEVAGARADREGRVITAFLRYALGPAEDYRALLAVACRERAALDYDSRDQSACAAVDPLNPPARSSP